MDIHPGQIGFAIALNHAQELPAVALIKVGMVGDQIGRGNALGPQIFHSHIQQLPGNALTTVAFLCIYGTNIRCQILAVVEVVLDHAQTANNFGSVQTKIPSQLGIAAQVSLHALQIGFFRNAPLAVEPLCGHIHKLGLFPKCNVLIFCHSRHHPFLFSSCYHKNWVNAIPILFYEGSAGFCKIDNTKSRK